MNTQEVIDAASTAKNIHGQYGGYSLFNGLLATIAPLSVSFKFRLEFCIFPTVAVLLVFEHFAHFQDSIPAMGAD